MTSKKTINFDKKRQGLAKSFQGKTREFVRQTKEPNSQFPGYQDNRNTNNLTQN